ncbi:hypothetical protein [Psychrobacillus sp. L3]|uniref:hypothetical protein n=1 Tax=Psychrobacillus sp. L3 TaxID=3236891 RepID=UPI0036F2B870
MDSFFCKMLACGIFLIKLYFKATKGIGILKLSSADVVMETIVYTIGRNDQSKHVL